MDEEDFSEFGIVFKVIVIIDDFVFKIKDRI